MDAIMAALEALQQAPPQARVTPAPVPPSPSAPKPAPSAPVPPRAAERPAPPNPELPHTAGLLQGMFEDGNSLLRAVVAAEILQPPLALRQAQGDNPYAQAQEEPAHWIQQPNEP